MTQSDVNQCECIELVYIHHLTTLSLSLSLSVPHSPSLPLNLAESLGGRIEKQRAMYVITRKDKDDIGKFLGQAPKDLKDLGEVES